MDATVQGLQADLVKSYEDYFRLLSKVGYKKYSDVFKLLAVSYIEEMLDGDMSFFITEEDYGIISRALECIYGDCLLPYPAWKKAVAETVARQPDEYRITESGILRGSNCLIRIKC